VGTRLFERLPVTQEASKFSCSDLLAHSTIASDFRLLRSYLVSGVHGVFIALFLSLYPPFCLTPKAITSFEPQSGNLS
jgi:hypothetical protein